MEARLHRLGLEYRLESAVDGQTLSKDELATAYDESTARRILRRPLFRGEVGLALSHRLIYQKMKEECIEEAVIMEDDVELADDFSDTLANCRRLPADWSILQLVPCNSEYPIGIVFSRRGNVHLYGAYHARQYLGASYGTQAYLIRRTYAEKLIPLLSPITLPIDTLLFDNRYSLRVPHAVCSREGLRLRPRLGRHTWMPSSTNPESTKELQAPTARQRLEGFFHDMRGLLSPMRLLLLLLSFFPIKNHDKLNIQTRGEWGGKLFHIRIYLSIVRPIQ